MREEKRKLEKDVVHVCLLSMFCVFGLHFLHSLLALEES